MWITQLSHWNTALKSQDRLDDGKPVSTFDSFNTRMICCKLSSCLNASPPLQ